MKFINNNFYLSDFIPILNEWIYDKYDAFIFEFPNSPRKKDDDLDGFFIQEEGHRALLWYILLWTAEQYKKPGEFLTYFKWIVNSPDFFEQIYKDYWDPEHGSSQNKDRILTVIEDTMKADRHPDWLIEDCPDSDDNDAVDGLLVDERVIYTLVDLDLKNTNLDTTERLNSYSNDDSRTDLEIPSLEEEEIVLKNSLKDDENPDGLPKTNLEKSSENRRHKFFWQAVQKAFKPFRSKWTLVLGICMVGGVYFYRRYSAWLSTILGY
jgi:hypothetical protein